MNLSSDIPDLKIECAETKEEEESISSCYPEDVYFEILARVPVKSLIACKCVCKSWCQLISTSSFVKMHHDLIIRKNNPSLMFTDCDCFSDCGMKRNLCEHEVYTIGYDSIISPSLELSEFNDNQDVVRMDYPFGTLNYGKVTLLGYCNGLVYFWDDSRAVYCLWNPATKEYKKIPKSPQSSDDSDYPTAMGMRGLGYDENIDDYKVINVVYLYKSSNRYSVQVYTLGTNSWKSSYTDLDMIPLRREIGVLVNGSLHWFCSKFDDYSKSIISLDISGEKLKKLEPPKEVSENKSLSMSVGALEGFLCILVKDIEDQFNIWVMPDYGVPESWARRYIINLEKNLNYNLMWSFENGDILLRNDGNTQVLYDPRQPSARKLRMPNIDLWNAVNYFESLVSVNSGFYVGRDQEEEEETQRLKIQCMIHSSAFTQIENVAVEQKEEDMNYMYPVDSDSDDYFN